MYLEHVKKLEYKKAFISQLFLIAKLDDRDFYMHVGLFGNMVSSNDICMNFINNAIKDLSYNNKDIEYELNETIESVEKYIEHIVEINENEFKKGGITKRVWEKYAKYLEEADNKIKKIIYFELYTLIYSLENKISGYRKFVISKLNISEPMCKEIENIVESNISMYRNILNIINIG